MFFGGSFFKIKFCLYFEFSNIWAKVYHILKTDLKGSTIVEIMGRRSDYISYSLNTVKINLKTNTQKQQQTR